MIKNVVFDIGRVLIGFEWADYIRSLFDEETAVRVTKAMWATGLWNEMDRGILSEEEILRSFIAEDPEMEAEITEAFDRAGECVKRRDWAIPLIESLKERGYNVYFLSNYSEHVFNANREALDFIDHMDGGVFSCDVKTVKPEPEIYRRLLDRYGLVPEECLFIDDNEANIEAAGRFGIKVIHFVNEEQMKADLEQALAKDKSHDCITVMCYGDSNTYGYNPSTGGRYPRAERWTEKLADRLGDRYEVAAEGLNGRTTAYDRPGAPWKNGLSSFVASMGTNKPVDYLVIMLGTNDCNAELGLSAEDIAAGMEKLVTTAKAVSGELQGYRPEIIVVAPAPILDNYEDSPFAGKLDAGSVRKSHEIGPLYAKIAERNRCRFVDANGRVEVSELDSEHLSGRGHEQMAELIWNEIAVKKKV